MARRAPIPDDVGHLVGDDRPAVDGADDEVVSARVLHRLDLAGGDVLVEPGPDDRRGFYTDALREIEILPDIERAEPVVVAMEVRLCIAAGDWGRGLKRAHLCEFADGDEHKLGAAEFYHAYAAHLCGMGKVEGARVYVYEAAKVCPAIRLQMLEDPGLAAIFGG